MIAPVLRVAALLLLLAPMALAVAATAEGFFDQTLGDFQEDLETARAEGKQGILIMFETDDCPFCHRMKKSVLSQPEVQAYFKKHFLVLSLDIEGDVEITDFKGRTVSEADFAFKQYRVRATPVFGFFDLDGNMVARYTGATSSKDEFMWLGEYVVEGAFKKMSFSRYKRQRRQTGKRR